MISQASRFNELENMIKIILRPFFLLVSISCIGYGWFSEIVSFAIAGAFVYILSVISSLVELIINSKKYRSGESVYFTNSKYITFTNILDYILLGCSALAFFSDKDLFRMPANIILLSQLSLFVVFGPIIEIFSGIPMQMTFGGWKIRGKSRGKK